MFGRGKRCWMSDQLIAIRGNAVDQKPLAHLVEIVKCRSVHSRRFSAPVLAGSASGAAINVSAIFPQQGRPGSPTGLGGGFAVGHALTRGGGAVRQHLLQVTAPPILR